jgi:FKBP-type peptidyl-prolyl cis-trans isomerase (trigger factor)
MYKGQTWQEHLEAEGMTEEEHRDKKIRPVAESQLKAGLVIAQIAIDEDVQVTRDELETRLQQLKAQYPDPKMQEELDKPENRREIANRMVSEKAIAKAVEIVTSGK